MTVRLLLVRHGVTAWNREGRFQGHLDAPLADEGRLEARLLGERLASEAPDELRIVTSPLSRAAETARIVASTVAAPGSAPAVSADRRLIEIGQGEWEGRTHAELAAEDAERYAAWRAEAGERQPPGAETIPDARARIREALDDHLPGPGNTLCLISHGGILRLVAAELMGLEPRRTWSMDVDNASLSTLARDGAEDAWRLAGWNDTAHLLGRTSQHVDEAEGEPLAL